MNGRQIRYRDEGMGDVPLVLVHAFPLDARMWDAQFHALYGDYRVIAPDLPGFGGSDPPADPGASTVETMAGDLAAFLDLLALERPVLVGQSLGGYVVLELARRRPDWPGGVVAAAVRGTGDTLREALEHEEQQRWLEGDGDLDAILERLLDAFLGERSLARSEAAKLVRFLAAETGREGWTVGLQALRARPDVGSYVHKIEVPALVLNGEDDDLAPPDAGEELAAQLPEGRAQVLPTGHLPNIEDPGAFNRALREFVEAL